ncbi:unnamed protein product [Clonostachys solani]|uniref:Uncharacterized protein n=1 Tax=Clonostachys solani TaxID=160281 RepID=A0A9P0EFB1_9HYPO|nr:unnamed protein product [Clonostachys solani]
MEGSTDSSTAQPVPASPDDIIPSTEIAGPEENEPGSPNSPDSPIQSSRTVSAEREEDEENESDSPNSLDSPIQSSRTVSAEREEDEGNESDSPNSLDSPIQSSRTVSAEREEDEGNESDSPNSLDSPIQSSRTVSAEREEDEGNESDSPNSPDTPTQPSRTVPTEREEDEVSIEETPSPPPTAPEDEEESTMRQRPIVSGHIPHGYRGVFYQPTIPGPYPMYAQPMYSSAFPPPRSLCYIQYSPSIEAARNQERWDWQPPPVSSPPPRPRLVSGRQRWYDAVKEVDTKDFAHTKTKKGHASSPKYYPPGPIPFASPTDPKPTLPYLAPSLSSGRLPPSTYAPSYPSSGGPSTMARSGHRPWSVYSGPSLHLKGHRQEPYEPWMWRRVGPAPMAPRQTYDEQPPRREASIEIEPCVDGLGAGPAAPEPHDDLPPRVEEASGPAISAPSKPRGSPLPKVHVKGHRREPYDASKRPRAGPALATDEVHDNQPHPVERTATETSVSADETNAALPIQEKKPAVDKGKAVWRPETDGPPA